MFMTLDLLYLYNGILFSHKRGKILIRATSWMNLDIIPNERKQIQKATYCLISFICSDSLMETVFFWVMKCLRISVDRCTALQIN